MRTVCLFACMILAALSVPLSRASAQSCATLDFTFSTFESRCMATGAITVTAGGGSGNYNYRVTGPVTTNFTSSATITGLQAGTYTVTVRDVNTGCQAEKLNVVVPGTYQDPRYLLSKTDVSCAGNDGTIAVVGPQYGRLPFVYTIIAPSPSGVGTSNATGSFSGLLPGEYAVQLTDSCGGIQVRRITITGYSWWFDRVAVTRAGCDSADAVLTLRDNRGQVNASSLAFTGFTYGIVNAPGDTLWKASAQFRFYTGTRRSVRLVARDACGTVHASVWNVPDNLKPATGAVSTAITGCGAFTATQTGGTNLTNPQYALYDASGVLVGSNTTGVFAGLSSGAYCMRTTDACYDTTISRCFTLSQPVPTVGVTVGVINYACAGFTARVTGQGNLTNPQFCLYNAANSLVACNATGQFDNVAYGAYCIRVTDGCYDTTISRCFTATRPVPALTGYSITGQSCTAFNVGVSGTSLINPQYCLYDAGGNLVTCNTTGTFTGLTNGSYCIRAVSCGDSTVPICFTGRPPQPYAGTVLTSALACTDFTAALTGTGNFNNPVYCLFNSDNTIVACNGTGTFTGLAYGDYCIRVTDGCYDTTITRCFTQSRPVPAVNAAVQQTASGCAGFTATVRGTNLTNPQYCLYDAGNNLVACNDSGIFVNVPYGQYCFTVEDGCYDTTIRVCQTFSFNYSLALATSKSCAIGYANVDVSFTNGLSPYSINVYHPNGSVVYAGTAPDSPARLLLPALPAGLQYKVTATDQCGRADSALVVPDALVVTKSIVATAKCPSAEWPNGSGDLSVSCTANQYTVAPALTRKDGAAFSKGYSSNTGSLFVFSDLEPATYVVEYTVQTCNTRVYDTFTVRPYAYPAQGRSAVYQCDNNSFSLGADVTGGVGPYNYQIIGSQPETPAIVSAEQSSPLFSINTGTVYSLIRLRSVDACGNATLNDVSILPLQNLVITADSSCYYQNVTLSVDSVPNAGYQWYRRTGINDSVLLTTNISYNLPYMQPEDAGTYICKVSVNGGCLTRISTYNLSGACIHGALPVGIRLSGRAGPAGNYLSWMVSGEENVAAYVVERKLQDGGFKMVGSVGAANRSHYEFTDEKPGAGTSQYRIRAVGPPAATAYSNILALKAGGFSTGVFPNPVHDGFTLTLSGSAPAGYRLELHNMAGQVVYKNELHNVTSTRFYYRRGPNDVTGLYVLKVVNTLTGDVRHYKLMFD